LDFGLRDCGLEIQSQIRNPKSKMKGVTRRIAATLSLIAFAGCLLIGMFEAENGFATIVQRALVAMVVTLFVGLVIGAMAQKMLDENLHVHEEKSENSSTKTEGADR
jgi:uncharacterized membrane protein